MGPVAQKPKPLVARVFGLLPEASAYDSNPTQVPVAGADIAGLLIKYTPSNEEAPGQLRFYVVAIDEDGDEYPLPISKGTVTSVSPGFETEVGPWVQLLGPGVTRLFWPLDNICLVKAIKVYCAESSLVEDDPGSAGVKVVTRLRIGGE